MICSSRLGCRQYTLSPAESSRKLWLMNRATGYAAAQELLLVPRTGGTASHSAPGLQNTLNCHRHAAINASSAVGTHCMPTTRQPAGSRAISK